MFDLRYSISKVTVRLGDIEFFTSKYRFFFSYQASQYTWRYNPKSVPVKGERSVAFLFKLTWILNTCLVHFFFMTTVIATSAFHSAPAVGPPSPHGAELRPDLRQLLQRIKSGF